MKKFVSAFVTAAMLTSFSVAVASDDNKAAAQDKEGKTTTTVQVTQENKDKTAQDNKKQ